MSGSMDSPIEYLSKLEADLNEVAERKRGKNRVERGGGGRARGGRWKTWSGAAAAFLVLAWGIGFLADSGLNDGFQALESGATTGAPRGVADEQAPGVVPGAVPAPADEAVEAVEAWLGYDVSGTATFRSISTGKTEIADLSKIVRDGSLSIEIANGTFERRFNDVMDIAEAHGGYVLESETKGAGAGSLTLRIPAARFDDAIVAVRALGEVTASHMSGEDITAEYVDLQARLTILEARRDVLLSLMTQATTIPQTITVQNALDGVQLKIEQIQGQLRFFDKQVAESTLKVELREEGVKEELVQEEEEIGNPSLSRALDRSIQGFFGVLATVIVGLGYLVPLSVLGGIGFGAVMLARRRRR